jgi:DNA-binding NtrC family response regulator
VTNERGQSILLVETDPGQRAATKDVLQSAGFQISCASSYSEAKRMLAASPPDMLITGLRLGEYNGLQLVLRTRVQYPEMAAIVTSETSDRVLEAEAERQCAQFLVRPLETDRLLTAVNRSFRNHLSEQTAVRVTG